MRALAWRWLTIGGLVAGSVATVAGCSSGDDDDKGTGGKGAGATGGTTGGTGAAGAGGTTVGGSSGSGGTGGTGGATGGAGGSTGGAGGAGATGGTAGTPGAGGAPPMAGTGGGGSAGTPATGGAPSGGMSGNAGSGGAAAGNGGGGMPATLVTPIMRSATSYVLEFGDTYFEVNPMLGARVTNVHLKGGSSLFGGTGDNSGSVFWPSPQTWAWPPTDAASVTEINDKPYTATSDDTSMTFVGTASAAVGFSATKKYAVDLAKEAVVITYTLTATASGKSAAPWEVTRFAQGGVTFYPTGSTPVAANGMKLPPTTTGAGCTWLTAPGTPDAEDQKMNADGTGGWLAHADGDWVVVKKFADSAAGTSAPNEAEIQVYLSKAGVSPAYMEVEQQGAYAAIAMGAKVDWTVTWFVRKLPSGVTATAASQPLVDFVTSLVQ